MNDSETFWILKNGIKMTGMPAFGPTHDDEVPWRIVGLWRRLPGMKPDQYMKLIESAGIQTEKTEHHHHQIADCRFAYSRVLINYAGEAP